ncbi:MAG: hypothetical protein ABJN65_16570 [Parasphingorhabdus sp.]
MTDKKDDKVTEAGAVELEENELDQVTGGASYLKLGDIKGESAIEGEVKDSFLKIDRVGKGVFGKIPDLKG